MNGSTMDSEAPFLPDEITSDILKRLPVRSLIRFQCVCKHWKNLIQSPSFVADHLHHSTHHNPFLLLQRGRLHLCLLDSALQVLEVQNSPSINFFYSAWIVGSCNGVLCVEIDPYTTFPPPLLLWNPTNRSFRYVPRRTYADSNDCVVGFGFSAVVNDYKIVRTYNKFHDVVNRVEVFSLSRGSWKAINIGNLEGVQLYSETVTANGTIFWYGLKLSAEEEDEHDTVEDEYDMELVEKGVKVIVSFDIANEVFTLIPMPDLDYNAFEKLSIYENKLAVLCYICDDGDDDERSCLIDLWVMEESTCASRERWSWTKIYTSSPCSYTLEPMTIWRNQIVCKASSEEDNIEETDILYMLNITTNEAKRLDILKCDYYSICNYVESLSSLGTYRSF